MSQGRFYPQREDRVTSAATARILIVDDQPDQCELLARVLRWHGHQTVCRFGAAEALAYLGEHGVDLLILDVMMPDIDGLELLRRLRRDAKTRQVPVAMYSAKSDPATRRQAADAGANDYWIKAYTGIDEIVQRIDSLLRP